MTSKHPERSVTAAIAKLDAKNKPKVTKKSTEDDLDGQFDEPVGSTVQNSETKDKLDVQQLDENEQQSDKDLQLPNDPSAAVSPDLYSPVQETGTHLMPPHVATTTGKSSQESQRQHQQQHATNDQQSHNQSRLGETLGSVS